METDDQPRVGEQPSAAEQSEASRQGKPARVGIGSLLGVGGFAVAGAVIALADLFAGLVPVGCGSASAARIVRTFIGNARRADPSDRRRARRSAAFGLLLAVIAGFGFWMAKHQASFGGAIYVCSAVVWFFFADVRARETAADADAGPLLGRYRELLDTGLESASRILKWPWVASLFGERGKASVNAFDLVAIVLVLLLGVGVAGADTFVKGLFNGGEEEVHGPIKSGNDSHGAGRTIKPEVEGTRIESSPPPATSTPSVSPPSDEGPLTPEDCSHPQYAQFLAGIQPRIGNALYDAWENVGVEFIGCLEEPVDRVGSIWMARLSGWETHNGLVVSDDQERTAVIFYHLRERIESLIAKRKLLYAGDRVKLPQGDYQIFFLTSGSCRLAIRAAFGEDVPYSFLPPAVSVLVIQESMDKGSFPASVSVDFDGADRTYVVDFRSVGSYSPPSSSIVLTVSGTANVSSAPYFSAERDSPCPDVRQFDALAAALE